MVKTHPADPAPTMMCENLFERFVELVEKLRVDELIFDEKWHLPVIAKGLRLLCKRTDPIAILEMPLDVTWYTVFSTPKRKIKLCFELTNINFNLMTQE